ncbi:MFS transporter [Paracoccus sediminis]|uniref:MFS transporter n=1 Tax=Paracoccus sediminis TaxID=1214787 RepID=A0A238UVT1_9RHOB|nr:MFS transporter [Paracoccus sediminis]TBN52825.1 MFS transporter [Paracoccus sediminis]SNR25453.1 MFS transporter, DHA2 family, multidrug resistance protein [Paracoccus sediminis]
MTARSPWLVLGIVSSALFLIVVDMTVLYTALPTLTRDLDASATEKLWIVNVYSLVVAGLLPGAGALGDRYGHRRMFMIGLVIFGAASLAAGFAPSSALLIAARAGLAVGAAAMMPATLSIIRHTFDDPGQRALAIGIWAAVASGGAAFGPVIGGALLEHFHWGAVFLVNLPVVAVALVLAALLVPAGGAHGHHPFDPLGSAQILVGLVGMTLAIKEIAKPQPSAVVMVASALIGAAALALFLRRLRCHADPMIDLTLFRDPRFAGGVIGAVVSAAALLGVQLAITQRLQLVDGLSPLQAGLYILPVPLAAFVAGPVAGLMLARVAAGRLLAVALAVSGTGVLIYWLGLGHAGAELAGFAVLGAGIGAAMTAASSAIMLNAPANRAGMAASIEEVSYELGGAFGIAILGSLMAGIYSAAFLAAGRGFEAGAADSLDGALLLAPTLPPDQARRLLEIANGAFDQATGAVALAAAVALLGAALWVGRINRADRGRPQPA